MIIFVFFNFLAFWPFPWQRQPFWKNQPLPAQLHMAYDIPTRFHKVWSRLLREIDRTKMSGRIIRITRIAIAKQYRTPPHPIILVSRFPWKRHFEFHQHAKSFHTLRWIFLRCFMKFDEKSFFFKPPFFYFHGNCGKVCQTDCNFFGLSHSTRCGCDRKHYCKTLWSCK